MWVTYLCVFLGAAIGGVGRYGLSGIIANWIGATFPWGTLIVNVTGCFVIGIFNTLTGPDGVFLIPANLRVFVMVGMCGGYTTFSSFSLQTMNLLLSKRWGAAVANIVFSTVFCFGLVATGWWIGHLV